jgi:hypothetical protein
VPTISYRPRGRVLLWLAFSLCLTSPLVLHGQGLTCPGPADNPFASDKSDSLSGLSSGRSFDPYSGEKRQDRVPVMQKEFTDASGFTWTQFFKSAVETGARFSAPGLFRGNGQTRWGPAVCFMPNPLAAEPFMIRSICLCGSLTLPPTVRGSISIYR